MNEGPLDVPGPGAAGAPQPDVTGPWRRLSRSHLRTAIAGIVGASAGAAYAHFVGCNTGTCPITSNVWVAAFYGATIGSLVGWPARAAAGEGAGERG